MLKYIVTMDNNAEEYAYKFDDSVSALTFMETAFIRFKAEYSARPLIFSLQCVNEEMEDNL